MASEIVAKATLVMFGGTGDLATRKLLPALFELWKDGRLKESVILAVGRRCSSRDEYLAMLDEQVETASRNSDEWKNFAETIAYHQGEIGTEEDFRRLAESVERLEAERGLPGRRLFYYAVGPKWFAPVTGQLSRVGLLKRAQPGDDKNVSRIVVEKPFGHDGASAADLDNALLSCVEERQIFRIDHYLGKETVQNVLAFRFANGLFEPLWNHRYITCVQITVAEALGVGDRADYYDQVGAMRDMVQNHMLQLLAVTAMEPPSSLEPEAIRDEKVKVLRSIRIPAGADEVRQCTVRGQYGPGTVQGESVPGYVSEPGVPSGSQTPTFVAARLYLDSWRWAHVPFLLRHGKRMPKRGTEIAIQFVTPPLALFRGTEVSGKVASMLLIRIQPNEGISLHFGAKKPGAGMTIENVAMDFDYSTTFGTKVPDSYKRLLLDALLGDATLFLRTDEVTASWRWADAVLQGWEQLPDCEFPNYEAGTWGPSSAECLFPQDDEIMLGTCPVGWRRF